MSETYNTSGSTTIAPDVLMTIAQLATQNVPGVSRMSQPPATVNRLLRGQSAKEGVQIEIDDDIVYADLYVVLVADVNVRDVSHKIQHEVSRAITEMVGLQVGRVNVHIEDIDYPAESEAQP